MLCNIVESHRVKCQQYWPEVGSKTYGAVFVRKISEQKLVDYVIRKFEVKYPPCIALLSLGYTISCSFTM